MPGIRQEQSRWVDYQIRKEIGEEAGGPVKGAGRSGIITYRNDRIRIISVRRSQKEEVDLYEG